MPRLARVVAPCGEDALRRAVGEAHQRNTRRVNFREGWRGHLWQGRFASFPIDDVHLYVGARYVELTPVRAEYWQKRAYEKKVQQASEVCEEVIGQANMLPRGS